MSYIIDTPVTFGSGNITAPGLSASSVIFTDASNNITSTGTVSVAKGGTGLSSAPTNGQILVGNGTDYTLTGITGTASQIIVTNGVGTITLSTPQNIATNSSPTFTGITLSGLSASTTVFTDGSKALTSTGTVAIANGGTALSSTPTNGQLLIGNGTNYTLAALTGTANQIVVTNGAGSITLSTPQSIGTASSPTFAGLTLSGLTANSFLYSGTAGALTTTTAPTNGQLLIGSTGAAPAKATLTGTTNQVTVTNGAGTITLATPQDIATASSPTFAGVTLSGLTASTTVFTNASKALTSTGTVAIANGGTALSTTPTNGQLLIGNGTNYTLAGLIGTSNQIVVTNGAGSITLSTPQNIATASSPTFAGLTLSGLTANSFLYSGTAGALTSTLAPTNGQLLIGSTGAAPVKAALTGTSNQVVVTNGAGSITLSTPQDIATASSPTFAGLTLSGLTANSFLYSGTAGALTSTTAPTNGQLLIGSTGLAPAKATLTGTTNQVVVTNGAGSVTLSTPQDIATASSPTFAGLTVTGLTASTTVFTDASKNLTSTGTVAIANGGTALSTTPTNGQLLIGNGTNYTLAGLTGTSNQITVTNGAGSITLSTPQSIATSSTPTFASMTLSATTNQLVLGVTNTTTITSPAPSSSRTYTIPDFGGAASFVLTNCSNTTLTKGTFSPSLGDGTNNFTLSTALGWWERHGDTLWWWATCVWTSKGSATGSMQMNNLPVASMNSAGYRPSGTISYFTGITFSGQVSINQANNTTTPLFVGLSTSGGAASLLTAATNFSASGEVQMSGNYRTA